MRNLINQYAYYIIAVVLVITLLLFTFRSGGSSTIAAKDPKVFYIDEETGEECTRSADEFPPLPGKSGKPTLVQAFKFSDNGGQTKTITYLMKFTDQAHETLTTLPKSDPRTMEALNRGLLIRRPGNGQEWVPLHSSEGQDIFNNPIPGSDSPQPIFVK